MQRTPQGTSATKGTASIEGLVLSDEGARPVRKASVTLMPEVVASGLDGLSARLQAETDADGHFAFPDLLAGRYRLTVQHPNFVNKSRSAAQLSSLSVTDGQQMKDLVLRLVPAAVVRGKILDEDGDPVQRVSVQVLRQQYVRGKRQLTPSGTAMTDDLGEFRIHGLPPGRYYIAATRMGDVLPPAGNAAKETRQYVRTFYPATTDMQSASQLQVRSGDEIPVNLSLMKTDTVLVRGTVLATDGTKAKNGAVYVVPADDSFTFGQMPRMLVDGVFEARVPPGRYRVTAMIMGDPPHSGSMTWASQRIEVPREGLEGVKVQAATGGAKVSGLVRVESGGGDLKIEGMSFSLVRRNDDDDDPVLAMMSGGGGNGKANKEGAIEFGNVNPGNYDVVWMGPNSAMQDWYLKSVSSGTRDITASGLHIGGTSAAQVQVVIAPGAPRIEGSVLDADQHAVRAAMVVAVPEGDLRKRTQSYRTGSSDQNGHFILRSVRPGRYSLFALEDVDPGAWMDPDFMKAIEDRGEAIAVSENDRKQVQLRLIPASVTMQAAQ
jgi:hypothetical protein